MIATVWQLYGCVKAIYADPVSRLDLERIRAARAAIDPVFLDTPQFECAPLGAELGCAVTLKVETLNPVRSFKGRGTETVLARLPATTRTVAAVSRKLLRIALDDLGYDVIQAEDGLHALELLDGALPDLLITDMEAAPPVAKDGFDQAFGLLAPEVRGSGGPGAVAKQGWMCCFSGQYYLHSAGAVGADKRFVLALLTRVPRSEGWPGARSELDGITAQAVAALE